MAGQLTIDAHLAGNGTTPQIDGTVKLTEGSFTDYRRGVNVTNIGADIVGEHGVLQIKSMTASAPPGTLSMTGNIGVLQPGWPVDLHVTAQNAQPLASKLITTNLNADMRVSGTAKTRLDVAGTVHLNRTVIGVASSLPPNVAVLDVRRRGKVAPPAPGKRLVVGLDVTLQAPREILLQGRNLDAELGGEVHITGTADAPVVTGGFDLQRGSFLLAAAGSISRLRAVSALTAQASRTRSTRLWISLRRRPREMPPPTCASPGMRTPRNSSSPAIRRSHRTKSWLDSFGRHRATVAAADRANRRRARDHFGVGGDGRSVSIRSPRSREA